MSSQPEFAIETPRLRLRQWRQEDAEPFIRHTNTAAVMRWLGGVKTAAEMGEMLARLAGWQRDRGFTFWVTERRSDGAVLGFCGLKLADGAGCAFIGAHEVGWRLREDCWGQGYAREAAIASLEFAFERLGAAQVVAVTCQQNDASWGLMERLGMRRRPELDYDDPRFPDLNPTIVYDIGKAQLRR